MTTPTATASSVGVRRPHHFVDGLAALLPWTGESILGIIGQPEEFASQIVRLTILAADYKHDQAHIDELVGGLMDVSRDHDLYVTLVSYPFGNSTAFPQVIDFHGTGEAGRRTLAVAIVTGEVLEYTRHSHRIEPLDAVLRGMNVGGFEVQPGSLDILGTVRHKNGAFIPYYSTDKDFGEPENRATCIAVHRLVDGAYAVTDILIDDSPDPDDDAV